MITDIELLIILDVFKFAFAYLFDYPKVYGPLVITAKAIWDEYMLGKLNGQAVDVHRLIDQIVGYGNVSEEVRRRLVLKTHEYYSNINIAWVKFSGGLFHLYSHMVVDTVNNHINGKYNTLSNTIKLYLMNDILAKMGFANIVDVRYVYVNVNVRIGDNYYIRRCVIPEFYIRFVHFDYRVYTCFHDIIDHATEDDFNEFYGFLRDYMSLHKISIEHLDSCEFSEINVSSYNKILMMKTKKPRGKRQKLPRCNCHVAKYMHLFTLICEIESTNAEFDCGISNSLGSEYIIDRIITENSDVYCDGRWHNLGEIVSEIGGDAARGAQSLMEQTKKGRRSH